MSTPLIDARTLSLHFAPDAKDYQRARDFIDKKSAAQANAMFKSITDIHKLFRRANAFIAQGWDVKEDVDLKLSKMTLGTYEQRLSDKWHEDAEKIRILSVKVKIQLLLIQAKKDKNP